MAKAFTVMCIVGARPNLMKIAPIINALISGDNQIAARLVHTGQHYDEAMNDTFFKQLGIPRADIDLKVGSASHTVQTAEIMRRFEPVLDEERPDAILVVGDVNSTLACALVAVKKGVPVIHVEAGLRSFDRTMPEEINRVLTDQVSELLFTTERNAHKNLVREGIDEHKIHFVGNVMIDTLLRNLNQAVPPQQVLSNAPDPGVFQDAGRGYALLTLHRPSNVDNPVILKRLLDAFRKMSERLPIVFPIHPRTMARIADFKFEKILMTDRILSLPPLGYMEMLGLLSRASVVLTDSGGIQEETTALGIPCVTLRDNTERPITVEHGTNTVVGMDPSRILNVVIDILETGGKAGRIPELWDGKAAQRIAHVLQQWFDNGQQLLMAVNY